MAAAVHDLRDKKGDSMGRRTWIIVVTVAVGALALVVGINLFFRAQHLSFANSPDGSWSVLVIGRRTWNGSYDLVVEVWDSNGKGGGSGEFVVGLTRDLDAAKRQHAVRFLDNDVAMVGRVKIEKSRYIKP